MTGLNKIMVDNALKVLRETGASALILFLDAIEEWEVWKDIPDKKDLVLVTRSEEAVKELDAFSGELKAVVKLPSVKLTRLGQIKLTAVMCITEGIIKDSDTIVCLTGSSALGVLDMAVVIDLARESEIITTKGISRDLLKRVRPEVLETVLNIALELASEGREGKAVGSTFVIGDNEKVMKLSRPLIMNPFKGYPDEARNILDEAIHETIKEFSVLDGAIVIRDDGVVMSAGIHLDAALKEEGLLPGLGSRHMAAAGITDVTDATAITISGSTGIVRIFRAGKAILEIERPLRIVKS
ncbi:MAG TPA: diadenylate cyclase [Thermodesulfobacteriota bacterium]|nr:diadenylate cyclase [Thermodesulfobacteriota bacterium]